MFSYWSYRPLPPPVAVPRKVTSSSLHLLLLRRTWSTKMEHLIPAHLFPDLECASTWILFDCPRCSFSLPIICINSWKLTWIWITLILDDGCAYLVEDIPTPTSIHFRTVSVFNALGSMNESAWLYLWMFVCIIWPFWTFHCWCIKNWSFWKPKMHIKLRITQRSTKKLR